MYIIKKLKPLARMLPGHGTVAESGRRCPKAKGWVAGNLQLARQEQGKQKTLKRAGSVSSMTDWLSYFFALHPYRTHEWQEIRRKPSQLLCN